MLSVITLLVAAAFVAGWFTCRWTSRRVLWREYVTLGAIHGSEHDELEQLRARTRAGWSG